MRWARRLTAGLLLPPTLVLATVVGTLAALLWTPPGRALTTRLATQILSGAVAGRIEFGSIGGNLLRHIVLNDVTVRDSVGGEILRAARIETRYLLPELLAGRIVLRGLVLERPRIHLVRLHRGRWNYEELFRTATGTGRGSSPPLVELHDVTLRQADLRVDAPTTPHGAKQPASRNAAAPDQPRIEAGPDGPMRVYTARNLDAHFTLIRVSTPKRDPILARFTTLRTTLGDPKLTLTGARGEILTAGDSLRFRFDEASLPHTTVRGGGAVRWPRDTVLFDFTLDAPKVDLADLLWISPDFPRWQGSGHVVAKSLSGRRTEYDLTPLSLGDGRASAVGRLVAIVDVDRGLGMRGLDLALRNVPVDVLKPYLDTLPVAGALTGRLTTDGFLDALTLGGDLLFADALVPGAPVSRFRLGGMIHFGGAEGALFDGLRLDQTRIAMATIHQLIPSIILPGDLQLTGRLDGPWQNARFQGTAEHVAPAGATSRMRGLARFDIRGDVLGLALDADFDPLSFDALRSGYPDITAQGGLTGHVVAEGRLDSLQVTAELSGEVGTVRANGVARADAPHFGARDLQVDLQRFDLAALRGSGPSTALNGRITATGTIDSGVPPRGSLLVALDQSRIGGVTVDGIAATVSAADGLLRVDTATVQWSEGRIDAAGTIGVAAPDSGTLRVTATAASLAPFDSLVRSTFDLARDTIAPHDLDGLAHAVLTVRGALNDAVVSGTVEAADLVLDRYRIASIAGRFTADSLGKRGLQVDAGIDSLAIGERVVDSVRVVATGRPDSLQLSGEVRMHDAHLSGGGSWRSTPALSTLRLDTLTLALPRQHWQLAKPGRITIANSVATLADTIALLTTDGSGSLTLIGSVPGNTPGDLRASIVGLDLKDVYSVLRTDSSVVAGLASLDLRLAGTRDAPLLRGSASVSGPVVGEVRAPMVRAAFDYQERQLRSRLSFWKTGDPILEVDVSVPYDLALASRADRKLPGPIEISAVADSVDLLVFEAFTPAIRSTRGTMQLDMRATGTWSAPRLDGTMAIHDGRMTLPSLGVRYGPINGRMRFSGDSMVVDTLSLSSGEGDLLVRGSVRFAQLTQPVLDLHFAADRFLAMDVPNYLRLRPSGDLTLQGPLTKPILTGDGTLSGSVLYFADLLNKNIIDLEDPTNADLVDTTAIRRRSLGAQFQSRFLDSLEIRNLRFRLGSEVWLRSSEANVQLEGAVTVNKLRKRYRLDGDFNAPRGTYTLAIGPVRRDFTIERGTVRYLGTPDLNALLDLQARHVVRTSDGEEIPIVANIGGSIMVPTLRLTSPGRALAERDLVSYLIFGRSEFQVTAGGQGTTANQAIQTGAALLSSLATNELQRAFVNDLGLGVDYVEIRPGFATGSLSSSASTTQFAAGWQLGAKWFVTFNAGFCLGGSGGQQRSALSARNFGASLEYRVSRDWRLQGTAEPITSCRPNDAFATQNRYQFGAGLLWQRDY